MNKRNKNSIYKLSINSNYGIKEKVKLIIGNGFDLQRHMETKYKNFYEYRYKDNENIRLILSHLKNASDAWCPYANTNCIDDKNEIARLSQSFNMWDIYFASYIGVKSNDYLWKDLEVAIKDSLKSIHKDGPFWKRVFDELYEDNCDTYNIHAWKLAFYYRVVNKKCEKINKISYKEWCEYLLSELIKFEKIFGEYIKSECDKIPDDVTNNLINFIQAKLPNGFITSIDSFNFSDLNGEINELPLSHINGNCDNPIFGIDSSEFKSDDVEYIFTKTARRILNQQYGYRYLPNGDYESICIFGHSLNQQDYNYFFPILDSLNVMDINSKQKIYFLYTIYDKSNEHNILEDRLRDITRLVNSYETYKMGSEDSNCHHRLFDNLTTRGRLFILEVENND